MALFHGNPATFSGTYMSYIAHEALYFNYEQEVFNTSNQSEFDEVTIFDEDIYTGIEENTLNDDILHFQKNLA